MVRAPTRAVRQIVIYAFMVVVGLLGGRILAAGWMFRELGWTATWLEISHWGPSYEPEPNSSLEQVAPTSV